MRASLFILPFLFATSAYAQRVVVRKVTGDQAVVEVIDGSVEPGDEFELSTVDPSTSTVGGSSAKSGRGSTKPSLAPSESGINSASVGASGNGGAQANDGVGRGISGGSGGDRSHVLGLSFNLSSLNSSADYGKSSANSVGVNARYGWNSVGSEYGVVAGFGMTDKATGAATTFLGGLFYDWNWVPNRAGEESIYGFGLLATYGGTNLPGGNGTTTTLLVYPAFFGKWFLLGNSVAFRLDLGYSYADDSSTGEKVKISGLNSQGGLAVYF